MNAAIYARESSSDTNKAPDIATQIEIGKKRLKEEGHNVVFVFADNGFSGGDWNRPEWNNAVRKAKGHFYKLLWTWNQDRLARDTEQFLWFYRQLSSSHVKVLSETEGDINMDTAGDRIKHTSLAMAAETFRLMTSDKVKRTYQNKKAKAEAKGEKVVWGRKPGKYDIDKILRLRNEGLGYKRIANELGNCSYQTVRRTLQNTPEESTHKKEENQGT